MAKTTSVTNNPKANYKKWLFAGLAASALALSACADKEPAVVEADAMSEVGDAQTSVEQEATGVDDVGQASAGVNSADISNDPLVNDDVAIAGANDDVGIATADDYDVDESEILDGTETEEHVSTY